MKRHANLIAWLGVALALAGCGDRDEGQRPAPHRVTADATGHYCGMTLLEHAGPLGQLHLASQSEPVWFSSARDAIFFSLLDGGEKRVRAIYVSDMVNAPNWDKPRDDDWVEARDAFFVIGSRHRDGMGAPETVPFSERGAAEQFARTHGGHVVTFATLPRNYLLSQETAGEAGKAATRKEERDR